MRRKNWAIASSVGLVASLGSLVAVAPSGADAATSRVTLQGTRSAAAVPADRGAAVARATRIGFELSLQMRNLAEAKALVAAVSDPKSSSYRHYLTTAQWEARFSPTAAAVTTTETWLRQQHLAPGAVSGDRMTVHVTGSVAAIEKAFDIGVDYYRVDGRQVRLATANASIPAALSGIVAGVEGVNETIAKTNTITGSTKTLAAKNGTIPQPAGFRVPSSCASYLGQKVDTAIPAYGGGYAKTLPVAPCGYTPPQFQGAYGLKADFAKGIDGKGVTVAIVDAYASPTLLSDSQEFYRLNDKTRALPGSQFSESLPSSFNDQTVCAASGWYGEQTLDVEAVHAMAPGAHILYVGAKNCEGGLYAAVQQVVDDHSADIITNSWGDTDGDILDSASTRAAFDDVLMMAAGTGIGVQFSAGDSGDEFADTGITTPDYPSSSPYVTSVGGTSIGIGADSVQTMQVGWSTSKSLVCSAVLFGYETCSASTVGSFLPAAPGAYDYGGGGGTSYEYPEPAYQDALVPTALADRNSAVTTIANRVEPDISMDGDPTTGMLVGETQTFNNGVYYGQYRIGGTSVSSPLFAGVMADADQAAGTPLGFANPVLYATDATTPSAFDDIVPDGKLAVARVDYANDLNNSEGTFTSIRTLAYEGLEQYCDGTGSCSSRDVALTTAPGFDSMTGLGSISPTFVSALAKA